MMMLMIIIFNSVKMRLAERVMPSDKEAQERRIMITVTMMKMMMMMMIMMTVMTMIDFV